MFGEKLEFFLFREGKGVGSLLCAAPDGPSRQKTPDPFSRTSPHLWITDFGLAHVFNSQHSALDSPLTMSGDLLGTLRYMSPEQASGRRAILDHRTDIYSLGVTLFELTTLQPAFAETDRAKLLRDILEHEPSTPRSINAAIPRDLETIILKSTAKDPSARYDSAQELADDLSRFLSQKPIHARRSTRPERLWRWCRRNPVVASLSAVVLTLLAILAIAGPVVAVKQANMAAQYRLRLYVQDIKVAYQAWENGDLDRVVQLLEAHRPRAGEEDLRDFAWHHLWGRYQRTLAVPTLRHPGHADDLEYSPDGTILAAACRDGAIRFWDAESHVLVRELIGHEQNLAGRKRKANVWSISFSPGGDQLASGGADGTVRLWDLATNESRILERHTAKINTVDFSPDGKQVASGADDGSLKLWNLSDGTFVEFSTGRKVAQLVFTRDGETIVAAGDAGVWAWDVKGADPATGRMLSTDSPRCVALSNDPAGSYLAAGGYYGEIRVWDTRTWGEPVARCIATRQVVNALEFSPDNTLLFSGGEDNLVRIWRWQESPIYERPAAQIAGHRETVMTLANSPGGAQLLSAGGDEAIRFWDVASVLPKLETVENNGGAGTDVAVGTDGTIATAFGEYDSADGTGSVVVRHGATGSELKALPWPVPLVAVEFSPIDPRLIALGGGRRAEGQVLLWELHQQRPQRLTPDAGGRVWSVAFSPSGEKLAATGERGPLTSSGQRPPLAINIWDVASQTCEKTIVFEPQTGDAFFQIAYAPENDHLLAAGGGSWDEGTVLLVNTLTEEVEELRGGHEGMVLCVAFSPDGRLLASGDFYGFVQVWDVVSRCIIHRVRAHAGWATGISFSPAGRTLATCSFEGTVKLRNVATGEELAALDARAGVSRVEFSKNGDKLLAGRRDGSLILWDAEGREEVLVSEQSHFR